MHRSIFRALPVVALLTITAAGCGPAAEPEPPPLNSHEVQELPLAKELVLLFTSDLHDHVQGSGPAADYTPGSTDDDATVGGFARLAARINQEREAAGGTPVLLLDAGDAAMGTLFSWLALTDAPTLTLMQAMGYDATTVGNHELDWTPKGFAGTLAAAARQGFAVPFLASNMVFSSSDSGDDELEQLASAGLVRERLVRTLPNGLKVGIFGLLGVGAASDAPLAGPLTFDDPTTAAKRVVASLRDDDGVDLVICLSHSGVGADGQGEDAELAARVPGIDVIISGHNHVQRDTALVVGKTLIVQPGAHGRRLGKLSLRVAGGEVREATAAALPIDDGTPGDPTIQSRVDGYIQELDALLQPVGMKFRAVVARTSFDLAGEPFAESALGDLITDAYRAAIDALEPDEPLRFTFEANGILGDDLLAGKSGELWLADLYRALPLGIGPDQQPGYPLVTFYLTGNEIKQGFELTANAEDVLHDSDFFLQVSGAAVTYDRARPPLDRVTAVVGDDGVVIDLSDTTTCYKVGSNYYLASMLPMVKAATGGALDIVPKEKDCKTPLADIATRIVDSDPTTAGLQELKQWQALIQYISALPRAGGDAVPVIPAVYAAPQGRIVSAAR